MADYHIYHGPDSTRRQATVVAGRLGSNTDETKELFVGSTETPLGYPVSYPQVPLSGVDVRRLWTVSSMGQANTWTDQASVVKDASGMVMTPRFQFTQDTDPIARGYIRPYELADGGTVEMVTYGTYTCGSLRPSICARLEIGGERIYPDYGLDSPLLPGFDVTSGVMPEAFDWSYSTLGSNALAGYEALSSARTNTPQGLFQWRLTTKVRALGRYAKLNTMDEDVAAWSGAVDYAVEAVVSNAATAGRHYKCIVANGVSTTAYEPGVHADWADYWRDISGNVAVEMTLEWGALHYNPGEPFSFSNPFSQNTNQYNVFFDTTGTAGVKRGTVYSFVGQQWLCHAGSLTNANSGTKGTWATTRNTVTDMLAEQAPGVGAYWKEFFVPLVSRKTFTAFGYMDNTVGNEVILEMGGPQHVDPAISASAYSATAVYNPELDSGVCTDGGETWVAKVLQAYSGVPADSAYTHMDAGAEVPLMRAAPTAALSGSIGGNRFWRQLATNPEDRYDDMRVQHTQAYLFGGRVGAYQERLR